MRLTLPVPPSPDAPQFRKPADYNRAIYQWAQVTKGLLENAVNQALAPCGQQFTATAFTTNTIATGTMTGTDVANCLASLVQTLTQKGLLSPTITRGQSQ